MSVEDAAVERAAAAVRDADQVVAMTGAGVSTASGIPDFRGEGGIWERHDPMDFHIDRFEADPAGFWTDRIELQAAIFGDDAIGPNDAHHALADLEEAGHLDTLVTQNIDGLHQDAGSSEIVEIHGSAARVACRDCDHRFDADPVVERARDGALPPTCEECGGTLKPDTVLFGEQLPDHAIMRAQAAAQKADLFLVAGSSLTVEPAASLPRTATTRGATLLLANLESTPLSGRADFDFRADVTDLLPRLRDAIES